MPSVVDSASSLRTDCVDETGFGDEKGLRASVDDSACNLCTSCMLWGSQYAT